MPEYIYNECEDEWLGHPGRGGEHPLFDRPCIGVSMLVTADLTRMPVALAEHRREDLAGYVRPCSPYQTFSLMGEGILSSFGLKMDDLAFEPREIVCREGNALAFRSELFASLSVNVRLRNDAESTDPESKLHFESEPQPLEFLVSSIFPANYMCLGWGFVRSHFQRPIEWSVDSNGNRIYILTASVPSFCGDGGSHHMLTQT